MVEQTRPSIALFDLGKVLMHWDPMHLYARMFPDPALARAFLDEINWPAWHLEHDRGAPFAETSAAMIARFPHHEAAIQAWFGRWSEMFDGTVPGTPEILHDLAARGVPLFALTNMPAEKAAETFALYPEMRLFRDVIVSGELRLVKPDQAIYAAALARMDARAEEVFFTDDSRPNIDAARALGFHAHLFDGADGLRAALIAAGLL